MRPSFRLVLALAVVVEVAFLLVVPRYVTVDGANHVGGAALIRDVLQGSGELHLRYVELATNLAPNLLPEVALALSMLVLDHASAERLLQMAYAVALPLALLYAVRSVRPGGEWIALLAIPLTFSFAFQYGFYDFSFGVSLFLVAAGYAWRHRVAPGWRAGLAFGLLALLLYLTHLVPYAELAVFLAVVGAGRVLRSWRHAGSAAALATARAMLPLAVGAVPSLALAVSFFLTTGSAAPEEFLNPVLQAVGVLGLATGLATTHPLEIAAAVVLALALAVLLLAVLRRRVGARPREVRDEDVLFGYALVALVVALVAPASVQSGGSYIPERLALFPIYGLALWLAAQDISRRLARLACGAMLAVATAILLLRLPITLSLSSATVEYESLAPCLAPRSTMIQVNLATLPAGPLGRTDPFKSEAGRIAAATGGHDIGNFEGHFPFFVFRNLPDNDPYTWLLTSPDGFEVPPGVDLTGYASRPNGTVDYVLVFGRPMAAAETLASPGWVLLRDQLDAGYRPVARSASGIVEAWERLDPTLGAAVAARRLATGAPACLPGAGP